MELIFFVVFFVVGLFFVLKKRNRNRLQIADVSKRISDFKFFFADNGRTPLPDRFFEDHYLMGFLESFIVAALYHTSPKASTETKGEFMIAVMQRAFPSRWQHVVAKINFLARDSDAEFFKGGDHASYVHLLALRKLKPELLALPEVQFALQNTSKASLDGKSTYEGASALLMANYLLAHKAAQYPRSD